ncbi:hypothetical protein Hsar01_01006 [Haloferula sargassicola]|uniref:Uncharacterized protein n=2 Tax=Haloferula sargassicola TaxID=490096 RepID=A0ABP9UKL8_9BACT
MLSVALAAGEQDPAAVALDFLGKLQKVTPSDEIDATEMTALFPGTTEARRTEIESALRGLANELAGARLDVVESRTEGSLAGVLMSATFGLNASAARVHPVALIVRDDTWLPAPVEGTFENLGIDYLPDFTAPSHRLAKWMKDEAPKRTRQLRQRLLTDLRDSIRRTEIARMPAATPPAELLMHFLEAAAARDLPSVLAALGGAEDELSEDFQATAAFVASSFKRAQELGLPDPSAPDHLLTVIEEETKPSTAVVSVGDFDCLKTRRGADALRVYAFDFSRTSSGRWQLVPSSQLLFSSPAVPSPEVQEKFAVALLAAHPPVAAESPEILARRALQAIATCDPGSLLESVTREESTPFDALVDFLRPLTTARKLRRRPVLLGTCTIGDRAAALWLPFDLSHPEIEPDRFLHFTLRRYDQGWLLAPGQKPGDELDAWIEEQSARPGNHWYEKLGLAEVATPAPLRETPADEAGSIFAGWADALQRQDLAGAFARAAVPAGEDGRRHLMEYLGTEFSSDCDIQLLKVHTEGSWTAATLRHQPQDPKQPATYLLHPLISTPEGPRILAEAILYTEDTRGRRLLNDLARKRLAALFPSADLDPLREILRRHEALAEEDRSRP